MHTAGLQRINAEDSRLGVVFEALVFYPSAIEEAEMLRGPYTLRVADNAEMLIGRYPLIIASHGTGGSAMSLHEHASALARSGMIVCVPEHPFNNSRDNSREGSMEIFEARCFQISMCIDAMLNNELFGSMVDPERIGYIGHSIGANVGMIILGAQPLSITEHRQRYGLMMHERVSDEQPETLHREPRIRAAVLLAMVPTWFQHVGALCELHASLMIVQAERDAYIPVPESGIIVNTSDCDACVEQHVVANAGHFSFLCTFNASFAPRLGPIAQDPPTFNRTHFSHELQHDMIRFFRTRM